MRILKVLMIPTALAIAPAATMAAPTSPGSAPEASTAAQATPVYHRGWRHDRGWGPYQYNYRPYRPHWRSYRYNYSPRCYWSRYLHRTVCR